VQRRGSAVLPARLLLDVTRSLAADEVSLEVRSSEQDVELIGLGDAVYFNQRRIDGLEPLTPRQMPVPAKELQVLGKPLYTFGGTFPDK